MPKRRGSIKESKSPTRTPLSKEEVEESIQDLHVSLAMLNEEDIPEFPETPKSISFSTPPLSVDLSKSKEEDTDEIFDLIRPRSARGSNKRTAKRMKMKSLDLESSEITPKKTVRMTDEEKIRYISTVIASHAPPTRSPKFQTGAPVQYRRQDTFTSPYEFNTIEDLCINIFLFFYLEMIYFESIT